MLKRKAVACILVSCLSLLPVPLINIYLAASRDTLKWESLSALYNFDFAAQWIAFHLYSWGFSFNPGEVIVGRDGWLFLGNRHERLRSIDSGATREHSQNIALTISLWNTVLTSLGTKQFVVIVAPNKSSIYPEYMPQWAQPSAQNFTDQLLSEVDRSNLLDLRPNFLAKKRARISGPAYYYKTDSHWNQVGAALAFQALARHLANRDPSLHVLTPEFSEECLLDKKNGGDLAGLLRIREALSDEDPVICGLVSPGKFTRSDGKTWGALSDPTEHATRAPRTPTIIESVAARNSHRVLWLRDSFGDALLPFMEAMFGTVLQWQWEQGLSDGDSLIDTVKSFKPDYVVVTVVERSIVAGVFSRPPNQRHH